MASLPNAPNITIRPDARDQALKFFWSAPTPNGSPPVLSYRLTDGGANTIQLPAAATFYTYSGLTNGTSYTFRIAASNAIGLGPFAFYRTVQPGLTPAAPTLSTVISTTGSLNYTVGWSNPSDLGGATGLLGTLLTAIPVDSNGNLNMTSSLWIQTTVLGGNSNAFQQAVVQLTSNYNYRINIQPVVDAGYSRIPVYTSTISSSFVPAPVFTPSTIQGMQLWLDGADSTSLTLSTSNVTQWNDKSGNAKNFSNTTGSARPVFNSTLSSLFFNNSLLDGAQIISTNQRNMHFFGVWSVSTTTGATFQAVFEQNALTASNGYRFMVYGSPFSGRSGNFYGLNGYGTNPTPVDGFPTFTVNSTMMSYSGAQSDGTTFTVTNRHNGSLYSTQTIAQTNMNVAAATTRFGRRVGGTEEPYFGRMSEVLLYSSILTANQYATLEGYLAWKWGLSTQLPSTHPFYSRAPLVTDSNLDFSPSSITTLQVWLDAADATRVTLSSSTRFISSLTDKSSNAYQFIGANGFTYNSTLFGRGYPSFFNDSFNNQRHLGSNMQVSINQPMTFLMVGQCTDFSSGNNNAFDSQTGNNRVVFGKFGTTNYGSMFAGSEIFGSINFQSTTHIVTSYYSTTSSLGFVNGSATPYVTGNVGTSNLSTLLIANRFISGGINAAWQGHLCEMLWFRGSLGLLDRQRTEGYLAWKWGLQGNLPLTHLYYFRAPTRLDTFTRFSPSSIAGLRVWIDAADANSYVLSGSNVISTIDKANGTVFSNASGFTYVANSFNTSFPSFSNGTSNIASHLGSNVSVTLPQPMTFFGVGRCTLNAGGGNSAYLFDRANTTTGGRLVVLGDTHTMFAGSLLTGTTNSLTSNFVIADHFSTTNSFMFRNGTQETTGTVGTETITNGLLLARRFDQSGGVHQPWVGNICEMLFFSTSMTAADRQRVEGYLAWKWGLQANLPTTHPFYYGSTVSLGPISSS